MRLIALSKWLNGLIAVFMISLANPIWAAKETGTFISQQACPAYVSKKKLSNPDQVQLEKGSEYSIIEANQKDHPSWYRVIVPTANPKQRWIKAECGTVREAGSNPGGSEPNLCNVAGQSDSYVLALSWQPAFCETKPNKPECSITDPTVYQARHFTLHGLWPNRQRCNNDYGFCGSVKSKRESFCDYPEINLDSAVRRNLAEVMPSVSSGSCLERHEWHKHGTCQGTLSVNDYYTLSIDLTRQFNDSGMAYFMNRKIGQTLRTEDFLNRLVAVLGSAAKDRVKLICKQNMLVEVQISLTTQLALGQDLESLIASAPVQSASECGSTFRVDPIGVNQ